MCALDVFARMFFTRVNTLGAQLLPHLFQLAAHRAVINRVAHAHNHSSEQLRIGDIACADLLAGHAFHARLNRALETSTSAKPSSASSSRSNTRTMSSNMPMRR